MVFDFVNYMRRCGSIWDRCIKCVLNGILCGIESLILLLDRKVTRGKHVLRWRTSFFFFQGVTWWARNICSVCKRVTSIWLHQISHCVPILSLHIMPVDEWAELGKASWNPCECLWLSHKEPSTLSQGLQEGKKIFTESLKRKSIYTCNGLFLNLVKFISYYLRMFCFPLT